MTEDWKEVEVPTLQTYLVKSEKREKGNEEVNGMDLESKEEEVTFSLHCCAPPTPTRGGGGITKIDIEDAIALHLITQAFSLVLHA